MGSLFAALLVLSTSPQGGDERPVLPVPPTSALIATGPLIDGRLPFAALGLGRGGVVAHSQRREATAADGAAVNRPSRSATASSCASPTARGFASCRTNAARRRCSSKSTCTARTA
jgi:hypothetical protein